MENINNIKSSLFKDNDGNIVIPKTIAEAVFVNSTDDSQGNTLDNVLIELLRRINKVTNDIPELSSSLISTSETTAVTSKAIKEVNDKIKTPINNLTSTDTTSPLSAAQGKLLNESKLNLSGGTMTGAIISSGDNIFTIDGSNNKITSHGIIGIFGDIDNNGVEQSIQISCSQGELYNIDVGLHIYPDKMMFNKNLVPSFEQALNEEDAISKSTLSPNIIFYWEE